MTAEEFTKNMQAAVAVAGVHAPVVFDTDELPGVCTIGAGCTVSVGAGHDRELQEKVDELQKEIDKLQDELAGIRLEGVQNELEQSDNCLYLIEQRVNTNCASYDAAIVCAPSAEVARLENPDGSGQITSPAAWAAEAWGWCAGPEHVTVTLIGVADASTDPGVVLASHNGG